MTRAFSFHNNEQRQLTLDFDSNAVDFGNVLVVDLFGTVFKCSKKRIWSCLGMFGNDFECLERFFSGCFLFV